MLSLAQNIPGYLIHTAFSWAARLVGIWKLVWCGCSEILVCRSGHGGGDHKVTTECPHSLCAELKAKKVRIFSTIPVMDWKQGLSSGAMASASIR